MAIQKISGVAIELDGQASGDVAYFDGTDWVRLAKGEIGEVLTMNESETAPEWAVAVPICHGATGTVRGYCATGNTVNSGAGEGPRRIERWSFTTDSNATDVGDCDSETSSAGGTSSLTHGYIVGGTTENIRKYSFASDGDSVDGGANLSDSRHALTGVGSETHGYAAAGYNAGLNYPPGQPNNATETIEKFDYATDSNATDVGDLVGWKWYATPVGSQV